MNLELMTTEELQTLVQKAQEILAERQREQKETFVLKFEATSDPRKGTPYVARLFWSNEKIERDFYPLSRNYGKKEVTVSGDFSAKAGDIIEMRTGGSWKNDYRAWYIVTVDGQLKEVASINDTRAKARAQEYLQGKISADELTESAR
ncbi:hypothetical protein BR63_00055 [Thermanaerosceptrum fracticalcis]|uniref:Uncharacterized protein n=1 Tax=Thermanaerosceptrum fracticalcis TaxID=1712410 RepID=A0A7G6DYF8_THEFR|nr:hypothetical protein [Thermanaerosceptrum fracticalcis]QNB44862.1 hypothetical protein BR63_00055 [Thermanaerosceptrum fracticalcis]